MKRLLLEEMKRILLKDSQENKKQEQIKPKVNQIWIDPEEYLKVAKQFKADGKALDVDEIRREVLKKKGTK